MGIKRIFKKIAKFILTESSNNKITINVSQINYNEILKDKKIVITGGAKGIGYCMTKKFISEGAEVVIIGRDEKKLKEVSEELGEKCKYISYDIANVENFKDLLDDCKSKLNGRIDSLVSNAGISLHEGSYKNVTIEGFDKQFDINFRANYFLCKEFCNMKENENQTDSEIIIISSETAEQCYDIPYGMTKAALNSLTGALAVRMYKKGVRVNAIAPGVTATDMTRDYADVSNGDYSRNSQAGRVFLPEEVAEVACFLLSNGSKCINGEVIHCNGGNHLNVFWNEE